MANKEKMKNALADLVKCKSVTGNRAEIKKVYDYIENLFPKSVFEVEYLENEGVVSQVVYFKGINWRTAKILLNGHIDVVAADDKEFAPRVEGNKIYGRGTADMKGGVVAMIFAMLELAEKGEKADCAMVLNSDEEVGGPNGVGYLVNKENLRPGFVLVADGPRQDRLTITTKEKGVAWLEITASGKAAHAARSWLGKNAIELLFAAWQQIKNAVEPSEDAWKSSAVLSRVETSNISYNCVPADARGVVDLRFTPEFAATPDKVLEKVKKNMPAGVVVKKMIGGDILNTADDHPMVLKLQKIMKKVCNQEVPIGFGHGASDARYFSSVGIPTALIGVYGGSWHSPNEWADLDTLAMLEESILEFLKN